MNCVSNPVGLMCVQYVYKYFFRNLGTIKLVIENVDVLNLFFMKKF